MKTVKIAFWNGEPPYARGAGGIATYLQHRAWVLSGRGFEVWWCNNNEVARFAPDSGAWTERRSFKLSRFDSIRSRLTLLGSPAIRYLDRDRKLDIIEFQDGHQGWLSRHGARPKVVFQCHTAPMLRSFLNRDHHAAGPFKLRVRTRLAGQALDRADAILACSQAIAFLESGYFKVHPDRFRVLPHAFSSAAQPGLELAAGDAHEDFFLVVGNVEYFKGFDLIMEGFRRYRGGGAGGRLLIAGTTGPSDPNPQVARMLRLPGIVAALAEIGPDALRFLGKLGKEELGEVRRRATATVIGSRFEAFTMVAGEAFLSRSPCILSDRTGWRHLAERFGAARLVSPYDPEDLARAMLEMHDPDRRRHYQDAGSRLAAYICSDRLATETAQFYRNVLG